MKKIVLLLVFLIVSVLGFAQKILIMGGEDHGEFLGYLNTSPYDRNSIWNEYGTYGNEYNSICIWNEYGKYGNEYNSYSPWNEYSSDVPILVDEDGNYYGKFNAFNRNEVVRRICKLHKAIQSGDMDLSTAYNILFGN